MTDPAVSPSAPQSQFTVIPPFTLTQPKITTVPGSAGPMFSSTFSFVDMHPWLDGNTPAVHEWVNNQNAYTDIWFNQPFVNQVREDLANQMTALYKNSGASVGMPAPCNKGNRYFFFQRDPDKDLPDLLVQDGLRGTPRILIGQGSFGTTARIMQATPSPNGKFVACSVSQQGTDRSEILIVDAETGKSIPIDTIPDTGYPGFGVWSPDSSGFWYVSRDPQAPNDGQNKLDRRLFYHVLGKDPKNDPIMFGAGRDRSDMFFLHLSDDGKTLIVDVYVTTGKTPRDDLYALDVASGRLVAIMENRENVQIGEDLFCSQGVVHASTNMFGDWGIASISLADAAQNQGASAWKNLIPPTSGKIVEGFIVAGGQLYVRTSEHVISVLSQHALDGSEIRKLPVEPGTIGGFSAELGGEEIFFNLTSFTIPNRIYRLDVKSGDITLFSETKVTGMDQDEFVLVQEWYESNGVKIPMFVLSKKGIVRNGENTTLMMTYGGFGLATKPTFDRTLIPPLRAGRVFAFVGVRGGGELGENWHLAATRENKQRSVDDLIAGAEHLIQQGYTRKERLFVHGWSMGGFVAAAFLNQRPDLCVGAIIGKPIADVTRDEGSHLRIVWKPEVGSITEPAMVDPILRISPYHNIGDQKYPPVLVIVAWDDDRVGHGDGLRYGALLQSRSPNPVLVRTFFAQGHSNDNLSVSDKVSMFSQIWTFVTCASAAPSH